jgi:CubicO group peptidase (beta-lactamase class C family)
MTRASLATGLDDLVHDLVTRHGIPGALVGVVEDGRIEIGAAGNANLNSGVEMTPDTLFLTGSITKVWTTTLLMSLIEEGLIDLDAPLRRYLPDLVLGGSDIAEALRVRHLVTHSTGLDAADMLADTGEGDGAIASFVDLLDGVGQLFEPGEYFSYNNAGFVLAGRIIEVVTGDGFSTAMRQRLFAPLGLERSMFTAKEAILHRVAIGHYPHESGYVPTSRFLMPESWAPAGTTLTTSVSDTLAFAQTHLPTLNASPRILSAESVERMAAHHIDFPVPATGSCGLGWLRKQHGRNVVLTHGGGSYGGVAMFGVVPDIDAAYIAFANGGGGSMQFHHDLAQAILEERFGLPPEFEPDLSGPSPDPKRYEGVYRQWGAEISIIDDGDALLCRPRYTDPILMRGQKPSPVRVRPAGAQALALADHPDHPPYGYGVGDDDKGHPRFLFVMDHLVRREDDTS